MSDRPTIEPDPTYNDWTDDELDGMATVNAATIADARADALRSDAELGAMLEANENDE